MKTLHLESPPFIHHLKIHVVTLISALIILSLVCSELIAYTTSTWRPSLVVDKSRKEKMPINFNITFPHMPCHSKV